MTEDLLKDYETIQSGAPAFYKQERGLIAVSGKEAVQFLNGMVTNDVAKLDGGAQMLAAFPNAQGRLVALVRVKRDGERFLFETEETTHEKVYNNLFRFTFAGDFFVEDISVDYEYFEVTGDIETVDSGEIIEFEKSRRKDYFVPKVLALEFEQRLMDKSAIRLDDELNELLRIENGIPLYARDMDDTTVVLETGLDDAVSFTKGCYIGQEIIARIHFRGHVAKRLTGVVLDTDSLPGDLEAFELTTPEGKNAGRLTSFVLSPRLNKIIALAYVRYDYLADGTQVRLGEIEGKVKDLPFYGESAQSISI